MPVAFEPAPEGTRQVYIIIPRDSMGRQAQVFLHQGVFDIDPIKKYFQKLSGGQNCVVEAAGPVQSLCFSAEKEYLDLILPVGWFAHRTCANCGSRTRHMCKCSQCLMRYCDEACQKADWPTHRVFCDNIANCCVVDGKIDPKRKRNLQSLVDRINPGFTFISEYEFALVIHRANLAFGESTPAGDQKKILCFNARPFRGEEKLVDDPKKQSRSKTKSKTKQGPRKTQEQEKEQEESKTKAKTKNIGAVWQWHEDEATAKEVLRWCDHSSWGPVRCAARNIRQQCEAVTPLYGVALGNFLRRWGPLDDESTHESLWMDRSWVSLFAMLGELSDVLLLERKTKCRLEEGRAPLVWGGDVREYAVRYPLVDDTAGLLFAQMCDTVCARRQRLLSHLK